MASSGSPRHPLHISIEDDSQSQRQRRSILGLSDPNESPVSARTLLPSTSKDLRLFQTGGHALTQKRSRWSARLRKARRILLDIPPLHIAIAAFLFVIFFILYIRSHGREQGITHVSYAWDRLDTPAQAPRVVAIILSWKRVDNIKHIVQHLCAHDIISEVFIWNNNPDITLHKSTFHCNKARVLNAPGNMLFYARHAACVMSDADWCFFQDDDWLVPSIDSLVAAAETHTPHPLVVHTTPDSAALFQWEWCFSNTNIDACFAWLGTGSLVPRVRAAQWNANTAIFSNVQLAHADNFFSTLLDDPPLVLESPLVPLGQDNAYSDSLPGIQRNKKFIDQGVAIAEHFGLPQRSSTQATAHANAWTQTPRPWPRAPCHDGICTFLSNVEQFPPRNATLYTGASLSAWEDSRGWVGRTWIEGGEFFADGETWAINHAYHQAVDGSLDTAFRSPDTVRRGDFIGLDVHHILNVSGSLHLVIEDIRLAPHLLLQFSADATAWADYDQSFTCRPVHKSLQPDHLFPSTPLTSSTATRLRLDAEHALGSTALARWWRRRSRPRAVRCSFNVRGPARYFRLVSQDDLALGWAVYEIYLSE